jgi:hypothetical protein
MSIYDLPGDTPGQVGPGRAATALYLSLAVSIALALALALVLSLARSRACARVVERCVPLTVGEMVETV